MSKLFSPDDLRRNGYTRYPRQFLSILIKDYCKDKKSSVKTGIMLYLYSKAAIAGTRICGMESSMPSRRDNAS